MKKLAISVAETVHASGMGKTTVDKLINEGRIASVRVGRRRLVIVASLQELLQ